MGKTLQLRNSNFEVLVLALGLFLLFLILLEFVFRMDAVQARLSAPSIGSRHRQLEIQFARLDRIIKTKGPVDCIILGNSMVWLGVDAQVVTRIVEEKTGQNLRCFNFGVSAMPASSAGKIASVLVDKYHPTLLIYGTFPRDYTLPAEDEEASVITDTHWVKFRNGEFNMVGWMYEVSYAYRYKQHVRNIFRLWTEEVFEDNFGPEGYRAYGMDPKTDVRVDVDQPPNLENVVEQNPHKWLYDPKIYPENLDGLRQIVNQSHKGVQVVVMEMPIHEKGFLYFKDGRKDYESYVEQVAQITSTSGTQFWRADLQVDLSNDAWWDYLHLTIYGAQHFSEWLGNQISEAFHLGTLTPLANHAE